MKKNVDFVILSLYDLFYLLLHLTSLSHSLRYTYARELSLSLSLSHSLLVGLLWTKDIMLLTVQIIFVI